MNPQENALKVKNANGSSASLSAEMVFAGRMLSAKPVTTVLNAHVHLTSWVTDLPGVIRNVPNTMIAQEIRYYYDNVLLRI